MTGQSVERSRGRSWQRLAWLAIGCFLGLGGSIAQAGELEIEWRAPAEPVLGFVIERRQSGEADSSLIARVGPETRRFIDRGAVLGFEVCYQVRAILGDGSWAPSPERCFAPGTAVNEHREPTSPLPPVSAAPPETDPSRVSDRFSPVPARAFVPGGKATLPVPPRETTKP